MRSPREFLRRAGDHLGRTHLDDEAEELRADRHVAGATPIADLVDRELATVAGTIRALTLPAQTSVPTLVAEVFDGDRAIDLIFIGRREVPGLDPGTYVVARGRVSIDRGRVKMYNPGYEIVPRHG